MFGFKKKETNGIANDLYSFLEEADALYIRAFETRSIGLLKEHFTRNCCLAISVWIVSEASSRYFSEDKLRETTWEIIEQSDTQVKLRKACVYKDVRLSLARRMKVSTDYEEEWTVDVTPEEFWVSRVSYII